MNWSSEAGQAVVDRRVAAIAEEQAKEKVVNVN